MKAAIRHLGRHSRVFGGIVFIQGILLIAFVQGLDFSNDIPETQGLLREIFPGRSGQLISGLTVFGLLLTTGSTASQMAGMYQTIVLLLTSLALIWTLRQTHAKVKVRIRDAFYKGMYPLVPFLLVLMVIALQLIPFAIGNALFNIAVQGGIAVTDIEKLLWGIFFALTAVLSLYMLASSVFALYIVTLPDMSPMQALRSARNLVRYRRWEVMRKLLILPVLMVLIGMLLLLPIIMFIPSAAVGVFFILSLAALPVTHAYLYGLYRELL
jgi:hypothetical protein